MQISYTRVCIIKVLPWLYFMDSLNNKFINILQSNMLQILWFLFIFIVYTETEINHGIFIDDGEFDTAVILYIQNIPKCMGTLITDTYVLTAAHCTIDYDVELIFIRVNIPH